MFQINYEALQAERPEWGRIALIPWDAETFGFGVADYQFAAEPARPGSPEELKERLTAWSAARGAELIVANLDAEDPRRLLYFQQAGFVYNDTVLSLCYKRLAPDGHLGPKTPLVEATAEDEPALLEIAQTAFGHGRYHADARFPRELANRRYRDWLRRSLAPGSSQRVLLAKVGGEIRGFSVVQIGDPSAAYFHLLAVAPAWYGSRVGIGLAAATIRYFAEAGAQRVYSKISAANTRVLNLHAALGARFSDPRISLHWHAPVAPHLLTADEAPAPAEAAR